MNLDQLTTARLKDSVTYYNVKAFEAYERGDYTMAADYTELLPLHHHTNPHRNRHHHPRPNLPLRLPGARMGRDQGSK